MLAAPALPAPRDLDLAAFVGCTAGILVVAAFVVTLAGATAAPVALLPALLGAGLLTAALNVAGVGAAATPTEVILYACVGVGFAVLLDAPALALALPLFVAGADVVTLLGGGSTASFGLDLSRPGDALAIELPAWGGEFAAGRLGAPDVVLFAAYAAYARIGPLRARAGEIGMTLGLICAVAWQVLGGGDPPTLALLGAGFLVPNLDRLRALLSSS